MVGGDVVANLGPNPCSIPGERTSRIDLYIARDCYF